MGRHKARVTGPAPPPLPDEGKGWTELLDPELLSRYYGSVRWTDIWAKTNHAHLYASPSIWYFGMQLCKAGQWKFSKGALFTSEEDSSSSCPHFQGFKALEV
jgi:hypothetical protein